MAWLLKKNQSSPILTGLAVIVGLLLIFVLGFKAYWLLLKGAGEEERIDQTTYQAIFLDDKQIYFGRLRDIDSQYPILEDVYYVKLESEGSASGRLVRLGETEPHSPKNQMILNRDHILFWENLKPDSQVVQTIINSKLKQ
ncbi:MAG: hypothetical protein AAB584_00525 [Patescibacteria group bacterium]